MLLPAFAPAVSAGVRPPRADRASLRESFRGALPLRVRLLARPDPTGLPATAEPLRLVQAATDDFPFRFPVAVPLVEWPFPFECAPLDDFALPAVHRPFAAGRAPFAGGRVPFAERVAPLRASAGLRAVRALAEGWLGLRFRE